VLTVLAYPKVILNRINIEKDKEISGKSVNIFNFKNKLWFWLGSIKININSPI